MSELEHFEGLLCGYFHDRMAAEAQRVGEALRTAAKYAPIDFSPELLPSPCINGSLGISEYAPSTGLRFNADKAQQLCDEYPELAQYLDEMRLREVTLRSLKNPVTDALARSGAHWGGGWGGHANPDYGMIVNLGTEQIREKIEKYSEANPSEEAFYRSCAAAMDALDILGDRYRALAAERAETEADDDTRRLFADMARAFETVPRRAAYDFTSAVCAFMLVFALDGNDSPGRFDQYMYRAYEATEDKDSARSLLRRLWDYFHRLRSWNLCISGSDENGCDETNELSYEILAITRLCCYETPNLTLRVHSGTPERLWNDIADTLALGMGLPALYNDEVVCDALERLGISPADSHDYCMNGCNQIDIFGKSHMGLEDGEVVFTKCLEFALHNGVDTLSGEQISLATGDAAQFDSYESLERAFMRQLEYVTYHSCAASNSAQHFRGVFESHPLRSCLIEGCLESGRDYRSGGPLYGHGQVLAEGIADTGDSLYAVKHLVFDEKKYTMAQLVAALDANFEGYETLWRDFSSCSKFGNDIAEVDDITARVMNSFSAYLKKNRTYRGGIFTSGCSTFNRAANYGARTGALPNGKRLGETLLADSIAATPGCDVNGPTAQIKSVLKYDQRECCSGFVFQNKFSRELFDTEAGKQAFVSLAKAYFAAGGQQYTVTVVSPEELLDAKLHPERHENLIVRVGGYSAYFVQLDASLQDNVIERTMQAL